MTRSRNAGDVRERMAAVTAMDPELDADSVLITFYIDDELPPDDRAAVEARMQVDPEFRRDVELMKQFASLPAGLGHTQEDDEWLSAVLERHVNEASDGRPTRTSSAAASIVRLTRSPWLRAASITAVGLLGAQSAVRLVASSHGHDRQRVATSGTPHAPARVATAPAHTYEPIVVPRAASRPNESAARGDTLERALVPPPIHLPPLGEVVVVSARERNYVAEAAAGCNRRDTWATPHAVAGAPDMGAKGFSLRDMLEELGRSRPRGGAGIRMAGGGFMEPHVGGGSGGAKDSTPVQPDTQVRRQAALCDSLAALGGKP